MGAAPLVATLEALRDSCLGIFGAGHLGRALAGGLTAAGFPTSRLLLCHRGSPGTRAAVEVLHLCSVAADELARRSRIVFVTLRPQDRSALAACPLRGGSLAVSFMAGVPLANLPIGDIGVKRARVMPSAPFTIAARAGIAGLFPGDEPVVAEICAALGLVTMPMQREETLHAFTVLGPCLPIVLAYWRSLGKLVDEAEIRAVAARHGLPGYERILRWARAAEPSAVSAGDLPRLLASAATRGGVTDAMLRAMDEGASMTDALERGVEHSRSLQR